MFLFLFRMATVFVRWAKTLGIAATLLVLSAVTLLSGAFITWLWHMDALNLDLPAFVVTVSVPPIAVVIASIPCVLILAVVHNVHRWMEDQLPESW